MESLTQALMLAGSFLPALLVVLLVLLALYVQHRVWDPDRNHSAGAANALSLLTILLVVAGVLGVVLTLPLDPETRGHLLSLIGIVVSAAIALSSTTFVGNAMAGFLLRSLKNVKPGDFIRVGEHFGRVSDQGLFHHEIQTEESNLTTLPNLYLVTNPVTVVRSSGTGTVISAEVSLGYDIPHRRVEVVLNAAAVEAELEEPYVQLIDLGDFSIAYRCSGFLKEAKHFLASQSRLRAKMLDRLHAAGIEIVSPTFMNQRRLEPGQRFLPPRESGSGAARVAHGPRIDRVFDKAERSALAQEMREQAEKTAAELEKLTKELKSVEDEDARQELEQRIARRRVFQTYLDSRIAALDGEGEEE